FLVVFRRGRFVGRTTSQTSGIVSAEVMQDLPRLDVTRMPEVRRSHNEHLDDPNGRKLGFLDPVAVSFQSSPSLSLCCPSFPSVGRRNNHGRPRQNRYNSPGRNRRGKRPGKESK